MDKLSILRWISIVYYYNSVGGNLHVVIDDGNLEDNFLQDDVVEASQQDSDQVKAENYVLSLLRSLTLKQREDVVNTFFRQHFDEGDLKATIEHGDSLFHFVGFTIVSVTNKKYADKVW